MTVEQVIHGHRAVAVSVLGAAAVLAIGVWGVVKLAEGEWFIGGLFLACTVLSVPSLTSMVRRTRRAERSASSPTARSPAGRR